MTNTLRVKLSVSEAIALIDRFVDNSFTGQKVDEYDIRSDGHKTIVIIYERYSYWAQNYVSLTVVIDDHGPNTRVHYTTSAGGTGILNFKYGSEKRFHKQLTKTLEEYQV